MSDNNGFIVINVAPLLDCDVEDNDHGHGKHGKLRHKHHDKNECELARD